ncbi:hypothetical protein evm_014643 [Chilo suppressalis]|nr:hypothetical protein evm_014643 [Chilo suppressalis]
MYFQKLLVLVIIFSISFCHLRLKRKYTCLEAFGCIHRGPRRCGLDHYTREVRWFLNKCDMLEFNCEYKTRFDIAPRRKCGHVPPL